MFAHHGIRSLLEWPESIEGTREPTLDTARVRDLPGRHHRVLIGTR